MFWISVNHFLFVGLFAWGNAETQTFLVSQNRDSFALVESVAPLVFTIAKCIFYVAPNNCAGCMFNKCIYYPPPLVFDQ